MVNIFDKKPEDKQSAKVSIIIKRQSKIISTKLTSTTEHTSESETKTCNLESLTTSVNKLIPLFNKIPVINSNNNSASNPVAYKNFVRSKKVIAI